MIPPREPHPANASPYRESVQAWTFGRLTATVLASAARLVTGLESRWIGGARAGTQCVYVANHTSHADFVLLWASLPPLLRSRTCPVAAAEYWNRGAFRGYLMKHVFQAVLIERNRVDRAHNPLAPMLQALDRGKSLIVFPEGTRGNGSELLPFKCGIYHLARQRPGIELVPVWIENAHRVLPRGTTLPVPLLCSVIFGEAARLAPHEDKMAFLARLRQNVSDLRKSCEPGTTHS